MSRTSRNLPPRDAAPESYNATHFAQLPPSVAKAIRHVVSGMQQAEAAALCGIQREKLNKWIRRSPLGKAYYIHLMREAEAEGRRLAVLIPFITSGLIPGTMATLVNKSTRGGAK